MAHPVKPELSQYREFVGHHVRGIDRHIIVRRDTEGLGKVGGGGIDSIRIGFLAESRWGDRDASLPV